MALPTLLPARKLVNAREEGERNGKVPSIQNKMANVFFSLSYKSLTIICFHANFFSFSVLDRQNAYSCKSDLFANFSAVYTIPCIPRYSLVFTSVSGSRRCWSLGLVRMCLFVMSIFTPPFVVVFWVFFIWLSHEVFFSPVLAESDDNA